MLCGYNKNSDKTEWVRIFYAIDKKRNTVLPMTLTIHLIPFINI
jgi:hypothetical protein